ncbi:MAG: hypothetical protein ABFS32_08925 [Bacteroidota bacterium]
MDTVEIEKKKKAAQINNALGLFILVFGVIVIVAMWFTETFVQQMTDLAAGSILSLIGGGMMLKARMDLKKLN